MVVEVEDVGYDYVEGGNADLSGLLVVEGLRRVEILTTVSVPMRTWWGACWTATISAMKLLAIPMIAMRQIIWTARAAVKRPPRAPYCAFMMMVLVDLKIE